jgi:hypothetical protein
MAGLPAFQSLVDRHREFHEVAGGIARTINRGAYGEAEDALAATHGSCRPPVPWARPSFGFATRFDRVIGIPWCLQQAPAGAC